MTAWFALSLLAFVISKLLNFQPAAEVATSSITLTGCLLLFSIPPLQQQLNLSLKMDRPLTIGAVTVATGLLTVIVGVFNGWIAIGLAFAGLALLYKIVSR